MVFNIKSLDGKKTGLYVLRVIYINNKNEVKKKRLKLNFDDR